MDFQIKDDYEEALVPEDGTRPEKDRFSELLRAFEELNGKFLSFGRTLDEVIKERKG